MEEENKTQTFYQKYKESILRCRDKWLQDPENQKKYKVKTRYRIQLYKNSYYKLKELVDAGQLPADTLDKLYIETEDKCKTLKKIN
jgi:hypothetical protein